MSTATFSIPIRGPGATGRLSGLGRPVFSVPRLGPGATGRLSGLGRPVFSVPRLGPGATGRLSQVETGLTAELETYYQNLRANCFDTYGPDFCNSVMPMSIYNAMGRAREGFGMPWWAWLIVGILAAKFLRL